MSHQRQSRFRRRHRGGMAGFSWEYDAGEERDAIGQRVSGYMFTIKDIYQPRSYIGTHMGYTEVLNSTSTSLLAAVYKVEESLLSSKGKLAIRCGPIEYIPAGGRALLLFARKAYSSLPGRTLYVYWHSLTPQAETKLNQTWQELMTAQRMVYQIPVPPKRIIEDNRGRLNARAIQIQDMGQTLLPTVIRNPSEVNTTARVKLRILSSGPNGVYHNPSIAILSVTGTLSVTGRRSGGSGGASSALYRVTLRLAIFGKNQPYRGPLSFRIRNIIRSALYEYDLGEWNHDRSRALVSITLGRKRNSTRSTHDDQDEINNIKDQFGDSAADGWMEGDIRLSSKSNDELGLTLIRVGRRRPNSKQGGSSSPSGKTLLQLVLAPIAPIEY